MKTCLVHAVHAVRHVGTCDWTYKVTMIVWRVGLLAAFVAATASAATFDNKGAGTCTIVGQLQGYQLGSVQAMYSPMSHDWCGEKCGQDTACAAYTMDESNMRCTKHGLCTEFSGLDANGFEFGSAKSATIVSTGLIAASVLGNDAGTGECMAKSDSAVNPPRATAHRHAVAGGVSVLLVGASLLTY